MSNSSKFSPEDIKLKKVGVFRSNLEINYNIEEIKKSIHSFHFCFNQNTAISVKNKAARIRLDIEIEAKDQNNNKLGIKGEFVIEFHYQISNFKNYFEVDELNEYAEITKEMGEVLLSVSYSTARGIIYNQTEGSLLTGIILPVVNPSDLKKGEHRVATNL